MDINKYSVIKEVNRITIVFVGVFIMFLGLDNGVSEEVSKNAFFSLLLFVSIFSLFVSYLAMFRSAFVIERIRKEQKHDDLDGDLKCSFWAAVIAFSVLSGNVFLLLMSFIDIQFK